MNPRPRRLWIPLAFLAGLGLGYAAVSAGEPRVAAWSRAADGRAPSPSADEPESPEARVRPGLDPLWWARAGDVSAATLWLGPALVSAAGHRSRPWVLVAVLPGSNEPLSCVHGEAALDGTAAIGMNGALFELDLRPAAGLAWGDVRSPDQLDVVAEGFQ